MATDPEHVFNEVRRDLPPEVTWDRLAEIAEASVDHLDIAPGVKQTLGFNWHRFVDLLRAEARK